MSSPILALLDTNELRPLPAPSERPIQSLFGVRKIVNDKNKSFKMLYYSTLLTFRFTCYCFFYEVLLSGLIQGWKAERPNVRNCKSFSHFMDDCKTWMNHYDAIEVSLNFKKMKINVSEFNKKLCTLKAVFLLKAFLHS